MQTLRLIAVTAVGALLVSGCSQPAAQSSATSGPPAVPATSHIRGTVASASATSMSVKTASGTVAIAISPKTGVVAVVPASRAAIKAGTFIGAANVAGRRTDRALEVVVFPNSMRGAGEGNYAWDLSPEAGGSSMMTNGTVASMGGHTGSTMGESSMMTNGTVSSTMGNGRMILNVTYKGGVQHIVVPANVPIVRIVPGSPSLLAPGAHVFVIATGASGSLSAARVIVGKNGAVPPM